MKGKAFVLDDIFWMLHLSSIDLDIYQSSEAISIYNYYLPEHNQEIRWRSFLKQIKLLPEATKLYVEKLPDHKCNHDEMFIYKTLFKVLWDHATLLSFSSYTKVSLDFFTAGVSITKFLPAHFLFINLLLLFVTPLRILKYRFRLLKPH